MNWSSHVPLRFFNVSGSPQTPAQPQEPDRCDPSCQPHASRFAPRRLEPTRQLPRPAPRARRSCRRSPGDRGPRAAPGTRLGVVTGTIIRVPSKETPVPRAPRRLQQPGAQSCRRGTCARGRWRCPLACRQPVATTNPMLYASPLCPAGRQLGAVRVAVEDGEERRRSPRRSTSGGCASLATITTEQHRRRARSRSRRRAAATPMSPSMPPKAITIGNVTGSSQMAGAPSCAPHRPTAIIREHVVEPGEGDRPAGQLPPAGAECQSHEAHLPVAARAGGC